MRIIKMRSFEAVLKLSASISRLVEAVLLSGLLLEAVSLSAPHSLCISTIIIPHRRLEHALHSSRDAWFPRHPHCYYPSRNCLILCSLLQICLFSQSGYQRWQQSWFNNFRYSWLLFGTFKRNNVLKAFNWIPAWYGVILPPTCVPLLIIPIPDINGLVGNKFNVQIPQVAVKWITYALFLHIVGLGLAACSAVFGLLAHVREMSMACCSTCVSGFAAGVTLIAFIFDLVLFFVAKARINAVGHASMGIAIWLTLAAWILLFFSGCFFALGRCCINKRGNRNKWGGRGDQETHGPDTNYAEQMRMEAVKAEADRKAQQAGGGGGLPAFYEVQPLVKTGRVDGDNVYTDYKDENSDVPPPTVTGNHRLPPSGYAPAPQGTRAVDDYYTPTPSTAVGSTTYPPRPQAQGQSHPERQASGYSYTPSTYSQNAPRRQASGYSQAAAATAYSNAPRQTSPPPANNQYLSATGYQNPYASDPQYGHAGGGSSCKLYRYKLNKIHMLTVILQTTLQRLTGNNHPLILNITITLNPNLNQRTTPNHHSILKLTTIQAS